MYETDTILRLKKQRKPDPETKEEFPYNRVRVVGPSPIQSTSKGDWTGSDAAGVVIEPIANFGGILDEPFGRLRDLYEVESLPQVEVEIAAPVRVITQAQRGPTPEEVFAKEAPGVPPGEGLTRGRTSPLGEDTGPKKNDPLA